MVDGIAESLSELREDLSRKANAGHPVLVAILLPLNSKHSLGSFCGDGTNSTHGPTILHCSHLNFSSTWNFINLQHWGHSCGTCTGRNQSLRKTVLSSGAGLDVISGIDTTRQAHLWPLV